MATIILIGWTYWEECGGLFPSVYIKSLFWWKGDPLIKIKKSQWKFRKLNYSSRAKGTDMGKGRVVKPVHTSPLGLRAVPVLRQEEPSSGWTSQLQEQTDWCCVSSMLGVSRTSEQGWSVWTQRPTTRAPLAWREYHCTVLMSCRAVPVCLEPARGSPGQHMYNCKGALWSKDHAVYSVPTGIIARTLLFFYLGRVE